MLAMPRWVFVSIVCDTTLGSHRQPVRTKTVSLRSYVLVGVLSQSAGKNEDRFSKFLCTVGVEKHINR